MHEVVEYNVWVHVEGVNAEGDTIQGDSWYEPMKVGSYKSSEQAVAVQNMLVDSVNSEEEEEEIEFNFGI